MDLYDDLGFEDVKSTDDFYTYNSRDFDETWGAAVWDETIADLNAMEDEMITEWD